MNANLIYVGIDDTDMPDTPGTNQLARALVAHVSDQFRCRLILRHQLLSDPRVPYTSKNGSASIWLEPLSAPPASLIPLINALRERMQAWYIPGSDPGLCVTTTVPVEIAEWGWRCQRELVTLDEAQSLARRHGIHLEGLGGTCGGMIGSLAAVGLASAGDDGRVVVNGTWADDLSGVQKIADVRARGIAVRSLESGTAVVEGFVDVGKHLRPNFRNGQIVLFVEPSPVFEADQAGDQRPELEQACWRAVRLT